jgi:hypothetical protein
LVEVFGPIIGFSYAAKIASDKCITPPTEAVATTAITIATMAILLVLFLD